MFQEFDKIEWIPHHSHETMQLIINENANAKNSTHFILKNHNWRCGMLIFHIKIAHKNFT